MAILRNHFFLLTALVIGGLVGLVVLLYAGEPHYPMVRAVIPGGVKLTFIENPWNTASKCEEESHKITNILRQQCPQCQVEFSGCQKQLNPSWEKSFRGEPGDLFYVRTATQHIMIEADQKTSQEVCIGMANQIESQRKQHARCIIPTSHTDLHYR